MSLTDDQLVDKLQELDKAKDVAGMRAVIKQEGGMSRILTLAARGLGPRPKKTNGQVEHGVKSRIPDFFPGPEDKAKAIAYWERKRRPDLVAAIEEEAEKFHAHHESRRTKAESWPATWQTWYANAIEFNRPARADGPAAKLAFEQTNEAGWLGRLRGFYEGGFWGDTWGVKPPEKPTEPMPQGCMVPPRVLIHYANHARRTG